MVEPDDGIRFLCRHIVPVRFRLKKNDDERNFVVTTFVLSVYGRWFLVTAGHCIADIKELIDSGFKLIDCGLIDFLSLGAKYHHPIPFDYLSSNPTCHSDDYAYDYGTMTLSSYYVDLLRKNNIRDFNEEAWEKQPKSVDAYSLLGIPRELAVVERIDLSGISAMLFRVERLREKPNEFPGGHDHRFYGRIHLGHDLNSIEGTSGGPIFAFRREEHGGLKYWVTALQSTWLPKSRLIAACPTKILGDFIKYVIGGVES